MTNLPPPPAEIHVWTDLIGIEATISLMEQHGGIPIRVPKKPTPESRLARDIGLDAAVALSREYGGDLIRVPLAKNWRVRYYHAQEMSLNEIARRIGCYQRTVAAILAGDSKRRSNAEQFAMDV